MICNLCPRNCGAERTETKRGGVCRQPSVPVAAKAMLHQWEEPCLVGEKGAGTVFFSGCNLRCCFCQNGPISQGEVGRPITAERLRFDFAWPQKLTDEQKAEVERLVNEWIAQGIEVTKKMTTVEEAKAEGAMALFGAKYGDQVSLYSIGDISKEICCGPHVQNTKELGSFKIKKEEASSAGVRRIKAVVTNLSAE